MAYTVGQFHLTNLLQEAYVRLGAITYFKATGGSATTAVNANTNISDNNLTGGLFVKETTDNAAPEGEYSTISAFAPSSGTFTTTDTLTAAIGSGDIFGYATPLYPLNQMVELANTALSSLGRIPLVDTTTLDTATQQTEYTQAVAWKHRVLRVDVQTNINDADDNRWFTIHDWEYIPAAAGSTGLLILPQLPASRDIRIHYAAKHPRVNSYADFINETVEPELAVAALVEKALEWQASRTQGNNPFLLQRLNDAREQLREAKAMYAIDIHGPGSRLLTLGVSRGHTFTPGKVNLS